MVKPDVDKALARAGQWLDGFAALRAVLLDEGLDETVKWGWPCYTLGDKNVVLIHGFQEHFALLFFKGSLLTDPHGRLVAPGPNTQAGRQMRFTNVMDVPDQEDTVRAFVAEAIAVERSGRVPEMKTPADFDVPAEFQEQLDAMPELEAAFESLTPGRQRQYLLHFSSAKQSTTRAARVEKHLPRILDGKGMND